MEKVGLPIKTKIAAWWMMGSGVLELIWGCLGFLISLAAESYEEAPIVLRGGIFAGGLLIIFSLCLFLLKQKRVGWGLAVICLFVFLIFTILVNPITPPMGYAPPPRPAGSFLLRLPMIGGLLLFFTVPSHFVVLFHFILFLIPLILLLESLSTEKVSLPTKTKIATWLMRITGILIMLLGMIMIADIKFLIETITETIEVLKPFLILLSGGFICFLIFWIREGKKWAWWVSLVVFSTFPLSWLWLFFGGPSPLSIEEIISDVVTASLFIFPFTVLLVPIILLLLDRKNFWKIAI